MKSAIALAEKGRGFTNPNPLVGAVIVKNGKIIAEGWHHKLGSLHAERDALKNAAEKNVDVRGASIYVTLEPCCHTGRQPPCTQAIIESGISEVIYGSSDPNPLVNGKGKKILEAAGIKVAAGFLKEECDKLNPVFFHYIKNKMPYVIIKYAMTADGKTSLSTGESRWITGDAARENVHRTRGTTSAIMCGIKTVLADDPMLNCRVEGPLYKQPVRVVLDRNLELPLESNLVKTAGEIPVIVFTGKNSMASVSEAGKNILSGLGVEIIPVSEIDGHLNLHEVLSVLGEKKIDSVFVESGGTLNASLFFAGGRCLVNELHCYVAPKITGGINGSVHSPVQGLECSSLDDCVKMKMIEVKNFGEDILIRYMICK